MKHRIKIQDFLFISILFLNISLPAQSIENLGKHLGWFVCDPYNLFVHTDGAYLASQIWVLGVSGLLMLPDDDVRYMVRENYCDGDKNPLNYINYLGTTDVIKIVGGFYGLTLLTKNTKLQDAAFTSLQSIAYAEFFTNSFKYIIGRKRPDETDPDSRDGQLEFDPFSGSYFSGAESFPSGHATISAAMITPWFMYYPHWSTALLFTAALGVDVARMGLDRHWSTDVLAGTGIGFFTGFFLSKIHQSGSDSFTL
ncbi:MAG: hypothetical protein B6241_04735, partial [Spirochaetaceae bacterium 4572_59]